MTEGIHCCREDDDLAKAIRHMEALKVRRLPVINKNKRMVGILSLGDVSHSAPRSCCPNASRAFRRITTREGSSRRIPSPLEGEAFRGDLARAKLLRKSHGGKGEGYR